MSSTRESGTREADRFREIVQRSGDLVAIVSAAGERLYVNPDRAAARRPGTGRRPVAAADAGRRGSPGAGAHRRDRRRGRPGGHGTWRVPPPDPGHRGRVMAVVRAIGGDVQVQPAAGAPRWSSCSHRTRRRWSPSGPGGTDGCALAGDLDAAGAPRVRDRLAAAVANGDALIADLRRTTRPASAGVALVAGALARSPLRVRAPRGGPVRRMLALSGVEDVVEMLSSASPPSRPAFRNDGNG